MNKQRKKKMANNYYIQGDPQKSDQIKEAFKNKGYVADCYDYGDKSSFFFTANQNKIVGVCSIYSGAVSIIRTHPDYQELHLHTEPRYQVGQTVLFNGRVVTIHRIIEGYYLFADNGSRGCRIDQQDKFVELKFKVGDYLKHKACDVTATVESIDVKGMCYRVHGYYPIPIVEQDEWENLDNPKFKVGDLVVYQDLIGRVKEVTWQDHFGFAYKVGNIIDINECALQPADHRDVTRIVKNG